MRQVLLLLPPITRFLFSHIGLCALLLEYANGAFTFQAIEAQNEVKKRGEWSPRRKTASGQFMEHHRQQRCSRGTNLDEQAREELVIWIIALVDAVRKGGIDGKVITRTSLAPSVTDKLID